MSSMIIARAEFEKGNEKIRIEVQWDKHEGMGVRVWEGPHRVFKSTYINKGLALRGANHQARKYMKEGFTMVV